jgi:hypothetical protein
MYYVYLLIDPRNDSVFYVGKGKNNRCQNHWKWHSSKGGNKYKDRVISKILDSGLEPVVKFLHSEIEDEAVAYNLEEAAIIKFGRRCDGGTLTNICIEAGKPPTRYGPDNGFYGKQHSDENRSIFAENAKNQFKGKKHTAEHIKKRFASFDREAARARRIEMNKTDKMRAVTAKENKIKGRNKTVLRVSSKIAEYSVAFASLLAGESVAKSRDLSGLSYFYVWQMSKQMEYYKCIIEEVENVQQK